MEDAMASAGGNRRRAGRWRAGPVTVTPLVAQAGSTLAAEAGHTSRNVGIGGTGPVTGIVLIKARRDLADGRTDIGRAHLRGDPAAG
ncbi:hypothetical protein [Actinoplanes nipponensis]|nr:hypothetical protein [Actinoplanes nipponensis]